MAEIRRWIEIIKNQGTGKYSIKICMKEAGKISRHRMKDSVKIQANERIPINSSKISLGKIADQLISYDPYDGNSRKYIGENFNVDGQMAIGNYLYSQMFGDDPPSDTLGGIDTEPVHLTIVSNDEHAANLPWTILACNGRFLPDSPTKWSITQSSELNGRLLPPDVKLGPQLRIVAAIPNPATAEFPDTSPLQHIDAIRKMIIEANKGIRDRNQEAVEHIIEIASDWDDFKQKVEQTDPNIIYYYGHGDKGRLIFPGFLANSTPGLSSMDFANFLRDNAKKLKIAYMNCCYGAKGAAISIATQLAKVSPAVLVNRTVAEIDAAQTQANVFWRKIIEDELTPHEAMMILHAETLPSKDDPRWMTPLLYANYSKWETLVCTRKIIRNKNWAKMIDRYDQIYPIRGAIQNMLKSPKQRCIIFFWYGEPGQGQEIMHDRIKLEIPQHLNYQLNYDFFHYQLSWPDAFERAIYENHYCDCCGCQNIHYAGDHFLGKSRNARSNNLIYFGHTIIDNFETAEMIKYLKWIGSDLVRYFWDNQYLIISFSFETNIPSKLESAIRSSINSKDLSGCYPATRFMVLQELIQFTLDDIRDFFNSEKHKLTNDEVDEIANGVWNKHQGHYMKTVTELRKILGA